jgi:DNA invertase Pin-like site-specific DNA recombinase
MSKQTAVAYYRTSSLTNAGADKDSLPRQQDAVQQFAKRQKLDVVREFYDPGVSGADPVEGRKGFSELLGYLASNGARTVLIENASRFARDLGVQIAGYELLRKRGYELIPVDCPDHFTNETPTAVMVRQILGAISEFERTSTLEKLKRARERKRQETGRCGGRAPHPEVVVRLAKKLYRKNPRTGRRRSLGEISKELTALGHLNERGRPYHSQSVLNMIRRAG